MGDIECLIQFFGLLIGTVSVIAIEIEKQGEINLIKN